MNWILAFEATGLVLIGFAITYVIKKWVKAQLSDALIFALVFTPMLLLALMTGKITELSGFGLSAKAGQIARAPVSRLNLSAEKFKIQELTSDNPDFALAAYFESCADYFVVKPSQIPVEEEKHARYIASVTSAVRSSIACGRLSGLVVLDDSGRYLGSYDRKFFVESTSLWAVSTTGETLSEKEKELSERIKTKTIFGASLQYPRERGSFPERDLRLPSTSMLPFRKRLTYSKSST